MQYADLFQGNLRKYKFTNEHQIQGLCPFHNDHNPSFSADAEKGLWKCFGCEKSGNAKQFAELLGVPFEEEKRNRKSSREIARYIYQGRDGNPLFQVRRYDPKGFAQFRFVPIFKKWLPKLNGAKTVLYHLPEVLSSSRVFCFEGEKDVDNARKWGLTATTNAGGAGKWTDENSDEIKGKEFIKCPDQDPKGQKHALKVIKSVWGKATRVKLVNVTKGKDFSEWIELGGTKEEFEKLVEETPWLTAEDLIALEQKLADKTDETSLGDLVDWEDPLPLPSEIYSAP